MGNEDEDVDEYAEGSESISSEDDEDSDSSLRCIHYHRGGERKNNDDDEVLSSFLFRYDEFASFVTRSERARQKPDKPPDERKNLTVRFHAANKETTDSCGAKDEMDDPGHHFDRAVLCHIQEIPKCPEEDFKKLFMTRKDFERIDTDVKMTVIRWTNHLKGRIKFDTEVNTIRGLEEVLDEDLASQKYKIKYKHQRAVLEEQHEQRCNGTYLDADQLRKASIEAGKGNQEIAFKQGEKDCKEREQCWETRRQKELHQSTFGRHLTDAEIQARSTKQRTVTKKQKSKERGFLFGLFGAKKGSKS